MLAEVSRRYQQILLKDYTLLNLSSYVHGQSIPSHSLSPISASVTQYLPIERESLATLPNKEKSPAGLTSRSELLGEQSSKSATPDVEKGVSFPKIIDVFSLNQHLRTQQFQTLKQISSETTPISRFEDLPDSQAGWVKNVGQSNASYHHFKLTRNVTRSDNQAAKVTETGNSPSEHFYAREKQCLTEHIDLTNSGQSYGLVAGDKNKCGGSLCGNNITVQQAEHNGVEHIKCEGIKNNCGERQNSHKRKSNFGCAWVKRRCTNKKNNQYKSADNGIDNNCDDNIDQQDCWFGICTLHNSGEVHNINDLHSKMAVSEESRRYDLNNAHVQRGHNDNNSNVTHTEETLGIDSSISDWNDVSLSDMISYRPVESNNIRQTKIRDLKARLAKQEEALVQLKLKNEAKETAIEKRFSSGQGSLLVQECAPLEKKTEGMFSVVDYKYSNMFHHQRQAADGTNGNSCSFTDEEFHLECGSSKEIRDPDRLEKLKGIYQHVIKSIGIHDARRVQSVNEVVENNQQLKSHSNPTTNCGGTSRVGGLEDISDQDEFLLTLGLQRIYLENS